MHHEAGTIKLAAVDPGLSGRQLWEAIQALAADWHDADQGQDPGRAMRTEQRFRPLALTYASLPVDGKTVTTGHKAILRSLYAKLGTVDMVAVLAMLDAVIGREEAAARGGA